MSIRERDNGAKALLKSMTKKATVKVGIMGSEASASHGTATNVEVASFHEFGLGVPKRSFIAGYVDENNPALKKALETVARRVGKGANLDQELERFGLVVVGKIQDRISAGIPPKLADSTRDRKNSSVQLINTGQLRSSITYVVGASVG